MWPFCYHQRVNNTWGVSVTLQLHQKHQNGKQQHWAIFSEEISGKTDKSFLISEGNVAFISSKWDGKIDKEQFWNKNTFS